MKFYTVGYEGTSIEEFTAFLAKEKIQRIADLRKNPISRKKGFSKRLLAENLAKKKIEYIHIPGLGVPREWRTKEKAGEISRAEMFRDFASKILPLETENLKLLRKLIREKRTAFLCFEADPTDCHRALVADKILKLEKNKMKRVDLRLHDEDTKGLPSILHDR